MTRFFDSFDSSCLVVEKDASYIFSTNLRESNPIYLEKGHNDVLLSFTFRRLEVVTMPSTVKVRVKEARNLPVLDRGGVGVTTDAFVIVSLGGHYSITDQDEGKEKHKVHSAKTKVCRRTLNPIWDEDFRFEVDDKFLQDEPLLFKVCDSGSLSYDESIGLVYVDLNPLLTQTASKTDGETEGVADSIDGWFPLYDTLGGVRGVSEILNLV